MFNNPLKSEIHNSLRFKSEMLLMSAFEIHVIVERGNGRISRRGRPEATTLNGVSTRRLNFERAPC